MSPEKSQTKRSCYACEKVNFSKEWLFFRKVVLWLAKFSLRTQMSNVASGYALRKVSALAARCAPISINPCKCPFAVESHLAGRSIPLYGACTRRACELKRLVEIHHAVGRTHPKVSREKCSPAHRANWMFLVYINIGLWILVDQLFLSDQARIIKIKMAFQSLMKLETEQNTQRESNL
jgi:hypothetical protein